MKLREKIKEWYTETENFKTFFQMLVYNKIKSDKGFFSEARRQKDIVIDSFVVLNQGTDNEVISVMYNIYIEGDWNTGKMQMTEKDWLKYENI